MKKTSLDKKFDKLRFLEENNKLVSKDQNRLISKFLNNKLAVLGLIIFSIINERESFFIKRKTIKKILLILNTLKIASSTHSLVIERKS